MDELGLSIKLGLMVDKPDLAANKPESSVDKPGFSTDKPCFLNYWEFELPYIYCSTF